MKLNLNKCEWYLYCSFLFFRNCDRKVFTWIRKFSRNNQVIYNVDTNMKMSKTSIVKIILSEHTAIVKPWKTTTLDRVLRHQFDINVQTFLCQWVFYLQFSWKNANSKHQRPNPTLFHWLTQYIWLCLPPTLVGRHCFCPVRHRVCQRNSSETTAHNFMKLGR